MKAKACTKCRQWKARCDGMQNGACSRCRALKYPCVFDASFKRTSKSQKLKEMSLEIQHLRQNLLQPAPSNVSDEVSLDHDQTAWSPAVPSPNDVLSYAPIPTFPALPRYRSLGDIGLTLGQVNECFRAYFSRCQQYLPFKMKSHSHEDIYATSPLLFWVICAVTSGEELRSWLSPMIKAMVADIHVLHRSIETVQALIVLCLWPFPVTSTFDDPSHFYSGLAVQIGLQIGLHCPTQTLSHLTVREATTTDSDVKLTTWLACFVINQIQSSILGLPSTMPVEPHLIQAFDHPAVDPTLSQLCHVQHLLMKSTSAISATPSGLLEPALRLNAIRQWGDQFAALQLRLGPDMVRISFLHARLQVLSFGLLDDMTASPELIPIIRGAEEIACTLIDLCYGQNLSVTPQYIRWAVFNAALVLIKLLRCGQTNKREVLEDKLRHVRHALGTTASAPDDVLAKACERLRDLLHLEDKKMSPSIVSRRGVSLVYDLLRISVEHRYEEALIQDVLNGFDCGVLTSIR